MEIKILGTGCPNCIKLENNTKLALQKLWIEAKVIKITDIAEIMSYNIMSTPWLVIDWRVVSSGKVLDIGEIIWLLNDKWCCSWQDTCNISCSPDKQKNTWGCSCGGNC